MLVCKIPNLLYFCGHRGSGKSWLLVQLLIHPKLYYQQYDKIFLFSPSLDDVNDNNLFNILELPDKQTFSKYDEKILEKIVKQKQKYPDEQWLLVMDDVIGDNEFKNSDVCKTICLNGRHMSLSLWVTSQKATLGSTSLRTNADGVYMWRARSGNEIEALYRDSCVNGINKKQFVKLYMDSTQNPHDFLFINYTDNTVYSNFNKLPTPEPEF